MKAVTNARKSARTLMIYTVTFCFLLEPYGAFAQKTLLPPNLISSEVASLTPFLTTLEKLSTQSETLEAKEKVSPIEKESVTTLSTRLKTEIPTAQRNLESIIKKVKSQGKWTPEFGTQVTTQISAMQIPPLARARFLELVKENGGALTVLEKGAQALSSNDVDNTLRGIQQKQSSSWLIGSAYANPRWGFWRCIGVLAIGVAAGMAGAVTATYGAAVAAAGNC